LKLVASLIAVKNLVCPKLVAKCLAPKNQKTLLAHIAITPSRVEATAFSRLMHYQWINNKHITNHSSGTIASRQPLSFGVKVVDKHTTFIKIRIFDRPLFTKLRHTA
jgi:hypothetical protein